MIYASNDYIASLWIGSRVLVTVWHTDRRASAYDYDWTTLCIGLYHSDMETPILTVQPFQKPRIKWYGTTT